MSDQKYCFLNGKYIPYKEAKLHVSDIGLLRSYAVFDLMRTFNGKPFRTEDHLKRFFNSARELRLPVAYSADKIKKIIHKLLSLNSFKESVIRLVITGGISKDVISIGKPNFFVIAEELPHYPSTIYKKGIKLITHHYLRTVPVVKSTHYLMAIQLQPLTIKKHADDILYCNGDEVLETTRTNFFIIKGRTLATPEKNILHGITKGVVLELAKPYFKIERRPVSLAEVLKADEAFITGTTKNIVPVAQIDDTVISKKPGDKTRLLMRLFEDYTKGY